MVFHNQNGAVFKKYKSDLPADRFKAGEIERRY